MEELLINKVLCVLWHAQAIGGQLYGVLSSHLYMGLKFEEILFGAQQRGCHGTLCLHAVPVVSRGSTGEVVART